MAAIPDGLVTTTSHNGRFRHWQPLGAKDERRELVETYLGRSTLGLVGFWPQAEAPPPPQTNRRR
jgi:hypothetical protein